MLKLDKNKLIIQPCGPVNSLGFYEIVYYDFFQNEFKMHVFKCLQEVFLFLNRNDLTDNFQYTTIR